MSKRFVPRSADQRRCTKSETVLASSGSRPPATWRTHVDYGAAGVALLVFNVSGGRLVERRTREGSLLQKMRAGSIGTVMPGEVANIAVVGTADTVTIFISGDCYEQSTRAPVF